jgi:alcohol dehydrogenase
VSDDRDLLEQPRAVDPSRVDTVSSNDDVDLVGWVKDRPGGLGVDLMYDCLGSGDSDGTNTMLAAIKPGQCAVAVCGADCEVKQSYCDVLMRDVNVLGSFWFSSAEIDQMITMIAAGIIDLSFLEHRRFDLAEVNDALGLVGSRPGGFVNVVVVPGRG